MEMDTLVPKTKTTQTPGSNLSRSQTKSGTSNCAPLCLESTPKSNCITAERHQSPVSSIFNSVAYLNLRTISKDRDQARAREMPYRYRTCRIENLRLDSSLRKVDYSTDSIIRKSATLWSRPLLDPSTHRSNNKTSSNLGDVNDVYEFNIDKSCSASSFPAELEINRESRTSSSSSSLPTSQSSFLDKDIRNTKCFLQNANIRIRLTPNLINQRQISCSKWTTNRERRC